MYSGVLNYNYDEQCTFKCIVKSPDGVEYNLVRLPFEAFSLSHFVVDIMKGETVKTGHTRSHSLQSLGDTCSRINSSHW